MTYIAYKDIIAKYEASNPERLPLRDARLPARDASAASAASTRRRAKRRWRCGWPRPRTRRRGKQLEDWLFERQETLSRDLAKQGLAEIAQVNSFDADYPKTLEAVRADVQLGTAARRDRHAHVLHQRHPGAAACGRRTSTPRSPTARRRLRDGAGQRRARGGGLPSRVYGRHSNRGSHQALHGRVLAPPAVRGPRRPDPLGRAGRGLRLPRPQRRRQDHHAQAADAADLPDVGHAPRSSAAGRRSADGQAPHRLPAGESVLLRPPHRRGAARVLRQPVRLRRRRAPAARVARCSTRSASAPSGGCSCASSRRACCSASASPRRWSTIPRWCSSTSRCRGSTRSAAARSAQLILRLRDRGCTVFFSSHVLADAEALCSRVAIVARGRLVAAGALSEMLAFQVHGWELVVSRSHADALECARKSGRVDEGDAARRGSLRARPAAVGDARAAARPSSRPPARSSCRSTRCARRSRTSSCARWRRPGRIGGWDELRMSARIAPPWRVHVFRESVRDKVLYNLVAFAVLLMAASYLIGQLTAGQDIKIIKDLGLAAIAIFGLIIAVFIGIGLVWKEVERRSIYSLLAKPLSRARVHPRQVLRPGADAGRQRGGDDRGVLRRAGLHGDAACRRRCARLGGAGRRSGHAAGGRPDPRGADAGHGGRAVLLHVLEPVAVGRRSRSGSG